MATMRTDSGPRHGARRSRRIIAAVAISVVSIGGFVGCGANDQSSEPPRRQYVLRLSVDDSTEKFDFVADDPVDIRAGDEVTFLLTNNGRVIHDLQVLDDTGAVLGTAGQAPVGGSSSATVHFLTAGTYRLNCNFKNHLIKHQMFAVITVTPPA